MKLKTKEPPHAFLPQIAEHFGGGEVGIKAAIVFHKIAVAAFNNEKPTEPLPFYDTWLQSTYQYFNVSELEGISVDYVLKSIEGLGAIELKRKKGYYSVKITPIGFTILNMVMEKE
jgi:hypothetical protein